MVVAKEYIYGPNGTPVKVPYFDVVCKYCGSRNVIKYGLYRGIQRFFCKDCGRKFADNDALPNMQTPVDQVGAAVGMFFEGQSLNSVRRMLTQIYGSYPSDSTIYRWVTRFSRIAGERVKDVTPVVGDVWIADETVLKMDNKNVWYWDIIDAKTRFLLASHISKTRKAKDAQKLMERAAAKAGKTPKVVLTDGLFAYLDGIEMAFGADTKHVTGKPFDVEHNTNLIERFHGTLKARTKVMRGLKDMRTAKILTDGWLLHYNYLRPHESLGNETPAYAAGIRLPYRNWHDVVADKRTEMTPSQTSTTSAIPIPMMEPKSRRRVSKRRKTRRQVRPIPTSLASIRR